MLLLLAGALASAATAPARDAARATRPVREAHLRQFASAPGSLALERDQAAVRRRSVVAAGAAIPTLTWTALGPRPIGNTTVPVPNGAPPYSGRVAAIAVSPANRDVAYLGAADGGVWKTVDGGVTWAPLFDSQPTLAIGAVTIDPNNPGTVYAGTGESNGGDSFVGLGLFRSTDGGSVWAKLGASMFDGCSFAAVAVRRGDSRTILVAVNRRGFLGNRIACAGGVFGGIYRSTDGGTTWTLEREGDATELVGDPTHADVWYAGFAGEGVYKRDYSTPGGWTQLPAGGAVTPDRIAIAIAPSNPQRVYAAIQTSFSNVTLFTSTDGGATWIQAAGHFCFSQCGFNLTLAVDPGDDSILYAGGVDLFRCTAGGASCAQIFSGIVHTDFHALTFDGSGRLWIGSDGGAYRADSTVSSLTNLNATLAITQFYPGISGSSGGVLLGGTQDNGVVRYAGSSSWARILSGDGFHTAIDPANTNTMYVTTNALTVFKSTDGGATWAVSDNGIATGGEGRNGGAPGPPLALAPGNGQRLYFGTDRVYRTNDGAASWAPISPHFTDGPLTAIAQAKSDAAVVYAGTFSGIHVTTTANTPTPTWTAGGQFFPDVTDIEVDPLNAAVAYLTVGNYGFSNVFRTNSTGGAWTDISGNLPRAPVNGLAVDWRTSPATLYAATDVGVFWSSDDGANWSNTSVGLPTSAVVDVLLDLAQNKLIAATHGRGMFAAPLPQAGVPNGTQLPNGNLELEPRSSAPFWGSVGPCAFEWATDKSHSASHALRIVSTTNALCRWITRPDQIPVTPGGTVTLSGWLTTQNVVGRAFLTGTFFNAAGSYIPGSAVDSSVQLKGTQDWTPVGVFAIAPPGARSVRLEFRVDGPGTAWADDFSAVANGTSPPPAPTSPPVLIVGGGGAAPVVGIAVSTSAGTWTDSPTVFPTEWFSCADNVSLASCSAIPGQTGGVIVPLPAQLGKFLRACVRAVGPGGTGGPSCSEALGPVLNPSGGGNPGVPDHDIENPLGALAFFDPVGPCSFSQGSPPGGLPPSGTQALEIVSSTSSLCRWNTKQIQVSTVPIPGLDLFICVALKTENVVNGAKVTATLFSANGNYIPNSAVDSPTQLSGTNDWTRVCFSVFDVIFARSVRIEVRLSGPGTVWADDFSLDQTLVP